VVRQKNVSIFALVLIVLCVVVFTGCTLQDDIETMRKKAGRDDAVEGDSGDNNGGGLPVTIEFTDASAEIAKTYGDPLFTNAVAATYLGTGTVTYSSSGETVATVNAQTGEVRIKGAGETIITAVKAADEHYAKAEASYKLTVAKATLTVTADNMAISYNADIPEYAYTVTGLAYGDTKTSSVTGTPVLSCGYAKGNSIGSYLITFSDENLSAANYNFVYVVRNPIFILALWYSLLL